MTDELTDTELDGWLAKPSGFNTDREQRLAIALKSERLQINPLRYFVGTLEAELERERTQNRERGEALALSVTALERCHLDADVPRPDVCEVCAALVAARAALSTQEEDEEGDEEETRYIESDPEWHDEIVRRIGPSQEAPKAEESK